jgi:hypothetical protein
VAFHDIQPEMPGSAASKYTTRAVSLNAKPGRRMTLTAPSAAVTALSSLPSADRRGSRSHSFAVSLRAGLAALASGGTTGGRTPAG